MSKEFSPDSPYDVIIAGAGFAGVLAANRLCQSQPQTRVLLLDRAPCPGGRALTAAAEEGIRGQGLHFVSPKLLEFAAHSFSLAPDADVPEDLFAQPLRVAASLTGGQVHTFAAQLLFDKAAARALVGSAGEKHWPLAAQILSPGANLERDLAFSKAWKESKTSPALTALKHLFSFCGVPDLWHASCQALSTRADYVRAGLFAGKWQKLLQLLLQLPSIQSQLSTLFSCRIVAAARVADHWEVRTDKGTFKSRSLLIAQAPWQAINWLERQAFPLSVLNCALKAKPASSVVLSLTIPEGALPWDVLFIPAEDVHCVADGPTGLALQTTIDYELSMDAPTVVKAIKRLRRASKKIAKALPALEGINEHIALVPVAWAQAAAFDEGKLVAALAAEEKLQAEGIAFCGDAYGASYNPDANTVKSIVAACEYLSSYLAKPAEH